MILENDVSLSILWIAWNQIIRTRGTDLLFLELSPTSSFFFRKGSRLRSQQVQNLGHMITGGCRRSLVLHMRVLLDLPVVICWPLVNDLWPLLIGCCEQCLMWSVSSVHLVSSPRCLPKSFSTFYKINKSIMRAVHFSIIILRFLAFLFSVRISQTTVPSWIQKILLTTQNLF